MRSGFAAILILLMGITAAGAGEAKVPEACKLLTLQDVTSVVGSGFQRPSAELLTPRPEYCPYIKGSADTVELSIGGPASGADLKDRQERFKKAGQAVRPVAGLGEGAFYRILNDKISGVPRDRIVLEFLVGQMIASLGVQTGGKPNVDATLKLARIVRARMP